MLRERRSTQVRELRADKGDDGRRYLSGYAATYNTLSSDLGWGLRERIIPGAFKRAVTEKQDVMHLVNHDPTAILGRTESGTTVLSEDSKGLAFRTLINEEDPSAVALYSQVLRGDINQCSFGFQAVRTTWVEEPDPENEKDMRCIRELHDVDLFDVSTVTYPAYPKTNTNAERSAAMERSMFPDGVPMEIRSRRTGNPGVCACQCAACLDADCDDCTDEPCVDENCRCEMSARSKREKLVPKITKHVDAEDLPAAAFLIVGDPQDNRTWKMPVAFSTEEKTRVHLRNGLIRFNQIKDLTPELRGPAWSKLVSLCQASAVDVSDSGLRAALTADQLWDFEKDIRTAQAQAIARAIQASL